MFGSKSPTGALHVTIIEARHLHDKDLLSKNDPYVELWVNEEYKQSTTVLSNTNDPVWNQKFIFNVDGNGKNKLFLKILDKDKFGSDKIGALKFDFEQAFQHPIDVWIKIPGKLGFKDHGEIHVYIEFHRTS